MNTDLEKFIHKNRGDFDDAIPPGKVWEEIERSLPAKKEIKRFSLRDIYKWSAAAAIFFIAVTSVYFLFIRKYSHEKQIAGTGIPAKPGEVDGMTPEYAAELRKVYQSVMSRQEELRNATTGQPELYRQFLGDLANLDSSYRMLTNLAAKAPNRELIIKAMIQNLQLQAELLERQLMIFNQFKNTKNQKNETSI